MDKKELTKLVSYFIMGDGGAYIIKKNAKFIMNMRAENKDYIDWVDSGVYYYMRLRSRDVSTFCEGVRPYIKDSFSYKIRMLEPFNKGCDIV